MRTDWSSLLNDTYRSACSFYIDAFRSLIVLKFAPAKVAFGAFFFSFIFHAQKSKDKR